MAVRHLCLQILVWPLRRPWCVCQNGLYATIGEEEKGRDRRVILDELSAIVHFAVDCHVDRTVRVSFGHVLEAVLGGRHYLDRWGDK